MNFTTQLIFPYTCVYRLYKQTFYSRVKKKCKRYIFFYPAKLTLYIVIAITTSSRNAMNIDESCETPHDDALCCGVRLFLSSVRIFLGESFLIFQCTYYILSMNYNSPQGRSPDRRSNNSLQQTSNTQLLYLSCVYI